MHKHLNDMHGSSLALYLGQLLVAMSSPVITLWPTYILQGL